jgi:hypothetical protein
MKMTVKLPVSVRCGADKVHADIEISTEDGIALVIDLSDLPKGATKFTTYSQTLGRLLREIVAATEAIKTVR